jgi:hypothetical protein
MASDDWLLTVVCAISGTTVFLIGLHDARLVRRLRRHGIRTIGIVVDQTRTETDSGHYWKPVISFTDQHGRTVTFQPDIGGKRYELPTGQEVPVVYLADNPKKARVDIRRFMSGALFLLFWGLVLLGVAVHAILSIVIGA